jgi:hypothetical protein
MQVGGSGFERRWRRGARPVPPTIESSFAWGGLAVASGFVSRLGVCRVSSWVDSVPW